MESKQKITDKATFENAINEEIAKKPKVSGSVNLYISPNLNDVLLSAEDEAKAMNDDYVSVEHLFLSMIKKANKELKELFKKFGISRDSFLKALSSVRGNQRITSDNPEETYEALEKYGTDLVEKASKKLDEAEKRFEQQKAQTEALKLEMVKQKEAVSEKKSDKGEAFFSEPVCLKIRDSVLLRSITTRDLPVEQTEGCQGKGYIRAGDEENREDAVAYP